VSADETRVNRYCFSAAYIVAFLHIGWGVGLTDTAIHFSNSAREIPVDWALGAMLMEVNDWRTIISDQRSFPGPNKLFRT
jgi:hypothetical protein